MLEIILNFLSGTLGTIAGITYGIGVLLPLYIIGFPMWLDLILIFASQLPFINILVGAVMWTWGLIIVLGNPITWLSIVYFVLFGAVVIYWLMVIIAVIVDAHYN